VPGDWAGRHLLLCNRSAVLLQLGRKEAALADARADPRVRGLLLRLGPSREQLPGLGQLQEIRESLYDFRAAAGGRAPTVAFSPALGEAGTNGLAAYYLASACERVYVQPDSHVSLMGA